MLQENTIDLDLLAEFKACRNVTVELTHSLSAEDMMLQSMPDASPTKWHLAHTSWFFECFILKVYCSNYRQFSSESTVSLSNYNYLFNSYYNQLGDRHARPNRGLLSRPSLAEVMDYRYYVDQFIETFYLGLEDELNLVKTSISPEHSLVKSDLVKKINTVTELIRLGLHHEMQHQELLLTDILHAFSLNPTYPTVFKQSIIKPNHTTLTELTYTKFKADLYEIGADEKTFYFDCEGPKHQVFLDDFALANRLITNQEWLEFIQDNGYQTPTLWLSDGWAQVQSQNWQAPLYWKKINNKWMTYGLTGLQPLELAAPVCHISYFEADAFAQWANARLPTEQEWEVVAKKQSIMGNFLESGLFQPSGIQSPLRGISQMYGDVWEWTRSAYLPYPKYKIPDGAIGEYNGKFMSGQFVLKGGSCATSIKQIRASYRNFFYPAQRWQFSGLRLAKDI